MALQVVCPHCGHPNGVGKVFCGACGANMQSASKPPRIISDTGNGTAGGRLLSLVLKLIFIGGPIALLVFMLAPTTATGRVGKRFQARDYDDALARIASASRVSGAPFVQILSEEQINAKLASELAGQPPATGMAFAIEAITLDLTEDPASVNRGSVTVHMLTSGFKRKLRVSYELTVIPRGGASGLEFDVVSARIGHVPLFANLRSLLVGGKIDAALAQMREERDILSRLRQIQIKQNSAALLIAPSPK